MAIFRQEAVEHQSRRLYGDVILRTHLSTKLFSAVLFIFSIAIALIVLFFPYSESERATGRISPSKGLVRVLSPVDGHVENLHVGHNEYVQKGQTLIDIVHQQGLSAGTNAIDALKTSLENERREIQIQIDSFVSEMEIKEQSLHDKIDHLTFELSQLNLQIAVLEESATIAEATLARFRELLQEDATSHVEVAAYQSQVLELEQNKLELLQRREKLKAQLGEASVELDQLPLVKQSTLASYRKELQDTTSRETELEIRKGAAVLSPVDGRVAALPVDMGQSINGAQLLLALIPEGGILEAELFVSAKSIGHIAERQQVRIFLDAFPFRRYGAVQGEVLSVSKTILYPEDLSESIGISGPAYRIKTSLTSEALEVGERTIPLQPGMTVSAMIVHDKRSLWRRLRERA